MAAKRGATKAKRGKPAAKQSARPATKKPAAKRAAPAPKRKQPAKQPAAKRPAAKPVAKRKPAAKRPPRAREAIEVEDIASAEPAHEPHASEMFDASDRSAAFDVTAMLAEEEARDEARVTPPTVTVEPAREPRPPATEWPAEAITVDPDAIVKAYERVRPQLENDPLFIKDADDFGVSLEELDARMQRAPAYPTNGDQLYEWLDGADQYRYAGLHVLLRALGGGAPATFTGNVVVPDTETRIARGDVTIEGNLELGTQAMVIVLGKLTVKGVIVSGFADYSMIAAREIECSGGLTGGELIATERIAAHGPFYFANNDYSARAPVYEGDLLVDFERGNAFTQVKVKQRISEWDFDQAAAALGVTREQGDLGTAFRDKLLG